MDYIQAVEICNGADERIIGTHFARTDQVKYRFVDLFAGLGGFHVGLSKAGHECVFACELQDDLRRLYKRNFGITPAGDIRKIEASAIPRHDVLCAGFPCQPFSLAGKKRGAACPSSGKLIDDVFRIAAYHRPKYVLLENVPNVLSIADGTFWAHIKNSFSGLGYEVQYRIYSPLEFGIPQQRYRLFVVASLDGLDNFEWPEPHGVTVKPLWEFIGTASADAKAIEPEKLKALKHWNKLVSQLKGFSSETILAAEFGATYPLEGLLPGKRWKNHCGAFGDKLLALETREEAIQALPHYADVNNNGATPNWMRKSILYSRALYASDPKFFDTWKLGVRGFHNSWQKLEWRGDRRFRSIWKQTLQFRASGIRVMKPEMAPSLIAMTPTQTPIIGAIKRYLGIREAASLQALEGLTEFPATQGAAFRSLGNAVNAHIVNKIATALLE